MSDSAASILPDRSWLAALVVKDGVMLGGLTDPQRQTTLALVLPALPIAPACTEIEINAVLKARLDGVVGDDGVTAWTNALRAACASARLARHSAWQLGPRGTPP